MSQPQTAFRRSRNTGLAWLWFCAAALVLCVDSAAAKTTGDSAQRDGYHYYEIGDMTAPRPGKTQPGLMLVGGGEWPYEAFRWMIGKAGHGRIVILRASGSIEAQDEFFKDIGGITSAQTLVFEDRRAASDPAVLEIVRKADGIFIAGGDQSNYVRYWKGTPLNDAINQHVRDGKPLGGTSAGLAIMGAFSYGAMDGGSLTSEDALKDPMGPAVTLVEDPATAPTAGASGHHRQPFRRPRSPGAAADLRRPPVQRAGQLRDQGAGRGRKHGAMHRRRRDRQGLHRYRRQGLAGTAADVNGADCQGWPSVLSRIHGRAGTDRAGP